MTKYESETWKSIGGAASRKPDRAPNRNVTRKPHTEIIGGAKRHWLRHMVPIHTKTFMPVGTAMRKLRKLKNGSSTWPVTNMWCAHTLIDSAPISSVAATRPL